MFLLLTSSLLLKIKYEDLVLNLLQYISRSNSGGLSCWDSGLVEFYIHILYPLVVKYMSMFSCFVNVNFMINSCNVLGKK